MTSAERSYRLLVAPAAVHAAGYIGIAALADLSGLHEPPRQSSRYAPCSASVSTAHTNWGRAGHAP
jgi:hypothetical protein